MNKPLSRNRSLTTKILNWLTPAQPEPDYSDDVVPEPLRLARIEAEIEAGIARQKAARLKRREAALKGIARAKARAA